MTTGQSLRIGALVFVAGIMQVSVFSTISIGGGSPDVLLVTLVAFSLMRGAVAGSVGGFLAGLLVDVATLGTLGMTSLLLTLAGFWVGRYGETTARGRPYALPLATVAATVFFAFGAFVLDSLLGGPVALGSLLLALPATLVWNVLLCYPLSAIVRRIAGATERLDRAREVELLV